MRQCWLTRAEVERRYPGEGQPREEWRRQVNRNVLVAWLSLPAVALGAVGRVWTRFVAWLVLR